MPLTEKQLQQRREAGKAAYKKMVHLALLDHIGDLDMAARHLTGAMRARWGRGIRGVTRAYMQKWLDVFLAEGSIEWEVTE